MFRLAEHLHKSVEEIEAMPFDEFGQWFAYFRIRKQDET